MFGSGHPLDRDVQRAYLARLDVAPARPSAEALDLLVRRHAERVPYETLWIQAGEAWGIDPHESAARIALDGRGGYCYHANGALGLLLSSLGYAVRGHVGGVHGPDGPDVAAAGNHLALTVEGLPNELNPAGVWYVDAGLGDALHAPLPLAAGRFVQPPFELALEHDGDAVTWHLTHDPAGGFTGMTWTMAHARLADFTAQHQWLSTSPDSAFVQVPMAERRDATEVDVVRGLVLSRIGDQARTDEPVTDRAAWFEVLAERFDLRLQTLDSEARDRLWVSALTSHRRWQEKQEASS